MSKDQNHKDPNAEADEALLRLLMRVDRKAQVTPELSPEAQRAVAAYAALSSELAVDRFAEGKPDGDAFAKIRQAWPTRPGF
jgi:hypothetical protein